MAAAAPHEPFRDDAAEAAETSRDQIRPVRADVANGVIDLWLGLAGSVRPDPHQSRHEPAVITQRDLPFVVSGAQLGPERAHAAGRGQIDQGDAQFRVLLRDGSAEAPSERLLRLGDLVAAARRLAAAREQVQPGRAAAG
ncbi:MAG: hypothetical protein ACRDSS_14460, partial [Actinocrinis sp.]